MSVNHTKMNPNMAVLQTLLGTPVLLCGDASVWKLREAPYTLADPVIRG